MYILAMLTDRFCFCCYIERFIATNHIPSSALHMHFASCFLFSRIAYWFFYFLYFLRVAWTWSYFLTLSVLNIIICYQSSFFFFQSVVQYNFWVTWDLISISYIFLGVGMKSVPKLSFFTLEPYVLIRSLIFLIFLLFKHFIAISTVIWPI